MDMIVDQTQKEEILQQVSRLVEKKYFNPEFSAEKWRALIDTKAPEILNGGNAEDFERRMHDLVSQLGSSHTAFYHRNWRPIPPRQSICATLQQCETTDGLRWMFQDVQEGGPAHHAGVCKGDLLLGIDAEGFDRLTVCCCDLAVRRRSKFARPMALRLLSRLRFRCSSQSNRSVRRKQCSAQSWSRTSGT
jgi:hypothetical protein